MASSWGCHSLEASLPPSCERVEFDGANSHKQTKNESDAETREDDCTSGLKQSSWEGHL